LCGEGEAGIFFSKHDILHIVFMALTHIQKHITAIALVLCCCVLFFVPSMVDAAGLINTSGCEVPGADTEGQCRNIEILLIQAISLIEYLFGIIGTLAFAMFIYGGLKMILSFGSEDKFKEGKEAMVNAVIGMIIAFSAYILVNFVLDVLGVKNDFRAVGGSSQVQEGAGAAGIGPCNTSADCDAQSICVEYRCTDACGGAAGQCGEWTAENCAAPNTIQSNLCPSPGGNANWKCCAPPSAP
jgi:hypothetical protein